VDVQAAEQLRKGTIDRALLAMTHAMNDIAHLSPGEVQRLIELVLSCLVDETLLSRHMR
jgi:hypothetical protein